MKINDAYSDGEVVFSKSAGDLRITDAGKNAVQISVSVNSTERVSFKATPVNGSIVLRLSEILEACMEDLFSGRHGFMAAIAGLPVVTISAGDLSWSHQVMYGLKPSDRKYESYDLLTRRPAQAATYIDGAEPVTFRWRRLALGFSTELMAEIYFACSGPRTVSLPSPRQTTVIVKDAQLAESFCSYSEIRAAADKAGLEDETITGWSAWVRYHEKTEDGEAATDGGRQDFVLKTGLHHTYLFRNIYGGLDTIYATGNRELSSDGEVVTFVNGLVESELSNDAVRYYEQNSGYIASRSAARFWLDFMGSAERYIYEDGQLRKIIVDENDTKLTEGELSSLKFKWHYADRNNDYNI